MIKKKPFVAYSLEEEREGDTREVIAISLNKYERKWLNELKSKLNIKFDGKAIKIAASMGKNVLNALFTDDISDYLFIKERVKLRNSPKGRDRL